jgi:hypothetical protein
MYYFYLHQVAYQGEPGAYSEKAARELLGSRITTVPHESFELAFKAVASKGFFFHDKILSCFFSIITIYTF